ncbi:hemagglutinin repeat-containing protein [Romboutsia sp.]|uniref:hemagglutinin repeat-containing protein n=1 Tax=Romboutsia sp. TaxID=1965302 RepID=UPI003F2DE62A
MNKVTLTTGTPNFNSNGTLQGFNVRKGMFVVGSMGLDGTNQSKFDIIARTAELNGPIYGKDELRMVLGTNNYDYNTNGVVTITGDNTNTKPEIALDAKALGSMYSGRIFLVSTEAGVGVNSSAEMLASAGDVSIDVNGNIAFSKVMAKANINIKGKEITVSEGVYAEKNLYVDARTLKNNGDTGAGENTNIKGIVKNTGNIFGKEIAITGNIEENSGSIVSNNSLIVKGNLSNSGYFYGLLADISGSTYNTGHLVGVESLILNGDITNKGNIIGSKTLLAKGNVSNDGYFYGLSVDVLGNVYNTGYLYGEENLVLNGDITNQGNVIGSKTLLAKGNVSNDGYFYGLSVDVLGNVYNTGYLSGEEKLVLNGDVSNSGNIIGENNLFINGNVVNDGLLYGKNSLQLNSSVENTNQIITDDNLTINGSLINTSTGVIYSKRLMEIKGNTTNNGQIASDEELNFYSFLDNLENGIIVSGIIKMSDVVSNYGIIQGTNLNFAKDFNNYYVTYADIINVNGKTENNGTIVGESQIYLNGNVNNFGIMASGNTTYITGNIYLNGEVNNEGQISSGNSLNINGNIFNKSNIQSNNITLIGNLINEGLVFGTENFNLFGDVLNSGQLISYNSLLINGNVILNSGTIYSVSLSINGDVKNDKYGTVMAITNVALYGDVNNYGNIVSNGELTIFGNIKNTDAQISGSNVLVTGGSISNSGTYGTIAGNNLSIYFGNIFNSGTFYGGESVYISGNNLTNDGTIMSSDIKLNGNNIVNSGLIYANAKDLIVISEDLTNNGQIISYIDSNYTVKNEIKNNGQMQGQNLFIGTIYNSGSIFANENITIGQTLNTGNIIASGNILFNGDLNNIYSSIYTSIVAVGNITNNNKTINTATIGASGDIILGNIDNTNGTISGSNLTLNNLTNYYGIIEGENIYINQGNSILDNRFGKIIAYDGKSAFNIYATNILNGSGNIISGNELLLNLGIADFILEGYQTNGLLTVNARSVSLPKDFVNFGSIKLNMTNNFTNNHKLQSYGELSIVTNGTITNNGQLNSWESMYLTALDINNYGKISTGLNLSITGRNLLNYSNSVIFSLVNTDISLSGNMTNYDRIFSSWGNIYITAQGDVNNLVNIINNTDGSRIITAGTIDAGNLLYISATSINNIGYVLLEGLDVNHIDGSAPEKFLLDQAFYDELTAMACNPIWRDMQGSWQMTGYNTTDFTNKVQYSSSLKGFNVQLVAKNKVHNKDANILSDNIIEFKTPTIINEVSTYSFDVNTWWQRWYNVNERYCDEAIWGVCVDYGYHDVPYLANEQNTATEVKSFSDSLISAVRGIILHDTKIQNGVKAVTIYSSGAGAGHGSAPVDTGSLYVSRGNVIQSGSLDTTNRIQIPSGLNGTYILNAGLNGGNSNSTGDYTIGKIEVKPKPNVDNTLPANTDDTGDNISVYVTTGVIIEEKKPTFSYLIETNIDYINMDNYYGSNYFFGRINFNPEKDIRVIGDPYYETEFVNKAILDMTGMRYLNGATSEVEQMQMLQDNALDEMEKQKLSIGISLSPEQIKNLKKDIVWYVEKEVNGVKVLVPQVFFCPDTLLAMSNANNNVGTGTIASGGFIQMNGGSLDNTSNIKAYGPIQMFDIDHLLNQSTALSRGTITAGSIYISSIGDITNRGGTISGAGMVFLESGRGNIVNESIVGRYGQAGNFADRIDSIGLISAGAGDVYMFANNGTVANYGGIIQAQAPPNDPNLSEEESKYVSTGSVIISAKDVVLDSIALSFESSGSAGNNSGGTQYVGSAIYSTGSIRVGATNNINITGSDLNAGGIVVLNAKNKVNIYASQNTYYQDTSEKKKQSFGRSYTKNTSSGGSVYNASNITGASVYVSASNDVNIVGSNIQSSIYGTIHVISQYGSINQTGVVNSFYNNESINDRKAFGFVHNKKQTSGGGEQAVNSNVLGGAGGVVYQAKKDVNLTGVNLVSLGDMKIIGTNVTVNPILTTKTRYSEKESRSGFYKGSDDHTASVNAGYAKTETESKYSNQVVNQSTLTAKGNLYVIADGGTANFTSVDMYSGGHTFVSGTNGVTFDVARGVTESSRSSKSLSIGGNAGVNSNIVNFVNTAKNIEKLIDKQPKSGAATINTIFNAIGFIRNGAAATNTVLDPYAQGNLSGNAKANGASSDVNLINRNWNDYASASVGINGSTSESHGYQETVSSNSIRTGGSLYVMSSNGSVSFTGTDIDVAQNFYVAANKDITFQSAEERGGSQSNSRNVGLSINNKADITVSAGGSRGNSSSMKNINTTVYVGGTFAAYAGGDLKFSGANVDADILDFSATNVIIESRQDYAYSKNESLGVSLGINLGTGAPSGSFNYNTNGGKSNWVNNQTSVVGRNGGTITAKENFKNIGAIVGSGSTENRLKIDAGSITIGNIDDESYNYNLGGGIAFDSNGINNVSVQAGGGYQTQRNNATAVNSDFTVGGVARTAESLGFNTDIGKVQESTGGFQTGQVNASYSFDTFDQVDKTRKNLNNFIGSLTNPGSGGTLNTMRENVYKEILYQYMQANPKDVNLLAKAQTPSEVKAATEKIIHGFLLSRGLNPELLPEIIISTSEKDTYDKDGNLIGQAKDNFFTVDGESNGGKGTIVIGMDALNAILNNKDGYGASDLMAAFAHELAHLNHYDDYGSNPESTANNIGSGIGFIPWDSYSDEEANNFFGRSPVYDQGSMNYYGDSLPWNDREYKVFKQGWLVSGYGAYAYGVSSTLISGWAYSDDNSFEPVFFVEIVLGLGVGMGGAGTSGKYNSVVFGTDNPSDIGGLNFYAGFKAFSSITGIDLSMSGGTNTLEFGAGILSGSGSGESAFLGGSVGKTYTYKSEIEMINKLKELYREKFGTEYDNIPKFDFNIK